MKSLNKVGAVFSIILLAMTVVPQANAKIHKKPVKGKKAIEACVSKWEKAYHSEPGWEDHPINYDQIKEWEDWYKKGRTPKNFKYKG